MRWRTGFLLGLGVGYILGARAGRERYEAIVAAAERLAATPTVSRTVAAAGEAARPLRRAAGRTLLGAADELRRRSRPDQLSRYPSS